MSAIDDFFNAHSSIQALPENATRILRMAGDIQCSLPELVKLISQDAALAGAILTTTNSAFYALPNRVTSLDRAVTVMGLRAVKEVTLATCLRSVCKPVSFGKYGAYDLWDHGVAVAVLARELAVRCKNVDPDEAFLTGLLHDMGWLMACQTETKKATELMEAADADGAPVFTSIEKRVFGFDHCELGECLADKWGFADLIGKVARWHHQPDLAPTESQAMCRHMYLTDTLCCQAGIGCPLTGKQQELTDAHYESAKVSRDQADALLPRLPVLLRLHKL